MPNTALNEWRAILKYNTKHNVYTVVRKHIWVLNNEKKSQEGSTPHPPPRTFCVLHQVKKLVNAYGKTGKVQPDATLRIVIMEVFWT